MANRLPLTDEEGEVRELDEEDFSQAVPFSALPKSLQVKLSELNTREPQKEVTKERITIRLSRDVVERFRATQGMAGKHALKKLWRIGWTIAKGLGSAKPQLGLWKSPKSYATSITRMASKRNCADCR